MLFGFTIVVVRDNVGIVQLKGVKFFEFLISVPYACGERLRRIHAARPLKSVAQQGQRVAKVTAIAWFVIKIPHENALVLAESFDNSFHIALKFWKEGGGVVAQTYAWILHPAAVMYACFRRGLVAIARLCVPTVVEEHKEWANVMALANIKKCRNVLL